MRKTKRKIPQLDSIEELARFWDTHDLTEFGDELEEVSEAVFARREGAMLTIRLRPTEAEAVKQLAQAKGIDQTALIREWVLEKIHGH